MNKIFLFSLFFIANLFFACSDASSGSVDVDKFNLPGMVRMQAFGDTVILGTNDSLENLNEMPEMRTFFAYDFLIKRHEVTRGEYAKLMNVSFPEEEKDYPVTNVTFYDAILYANELSKKHEFDTIYTYQNPKFNQAGNCISLEGLNVAYEKSGFRLPTEAEWIYTASKHWNLETSWTAENSNYKVHKVCSAAENASRSTFCDLGGNVKEWVNDWLGNFQDTTLINYVGAVRGGAQKERIIKGGAYNEERAKTKLFHRGDVYTVTSDMAADYVGFRVAFGAILNYSKMDAEGRVIDCDVEATVNIDALRKKLGTVRGKLAYRDEISGDIGFVDFSTGSPVPRQIRDTINAYHPAISPDGNYLVYSTKEEGVSGESELYILPLRTSGFPTKLKVESAAIPSWKILDNGDTVVRYMTSAKINQNEDWLEESMWQIHVSKGRFRGKPEKIMNGTFNGGISEDEKLAISGARLLRARIAKENSSILQSYTDTIWYNGEQACNASLSSDGTKRTLFLDFSGKTGTEFVNEKYRVHERILVVDSTGKLIQTVKAPAGYTFDHTEWVPRSNLAVATLTSPNGMHPKIVLVDFSDSSVIDLVESVDLKFPTMWLYDNLPPQKESSISADSAGYYCDPESGDELMIWRYKLELLWRYRDTADIVVIGSSRSMGGVDPFFLKTGFAINLSQTPNSIYVSRDFFSRYVLGNVKNLKTLILSLDLDFFWKHDIPVENFWISDYKNYKGYIYDENHNYWKDSSITEFLPFVENSYGSEEPDNYLYHRGFAYWQPKEQDTTPAVKEDSTWNLIYPEAIPNSISALKEIIQMAAEYNVNVVGVIFPMNSRFKYTGAYGRYGLLRSSAPALIQEIKDIENEFKNFYLVDEYKMGEHDYTDAYFLDDDHLNYLGGRILTVRLNAFLDSLSKK